MLPHCPFLPSLLILAVMKKIALICAIPQESRQILRRLSNPSKAYLKDMPIWNCQSSNLHVILAETGIGMTRAAEAAKNIIRFATPDIVISTGFCGAVSPGLLSSDIVLAERVLNYTTTLHPYSVSIDRSLFNILSAPGNINFHPGTFITTKEMVAKCQIAALLDDRIANPVIEMESHAVAEVCNSCGIPFAAIRAVSDPADQDPQPVCSKIFTADMKISLLKTLKCVITAPQTTRKLIQLYTGAEAAGRSLARAIEFSLNRLQ